MGPDWQREESAAVNEQDYIAGSNAAWARMLAECLRNLPSGRPELTHASLVSERASAIAALRDLCERFGDNDWPDNLHLADIIEKHLLRHLDAP
jgi:hypothetical protein